jgi:hypothetical protein
VTAKRSGRAANGRPSVYLGKDGRWHGRVTMGLKSDSTPDRRHVMGLTQAAVTAKVRALEEQRRTGTVADAGRSPTVEEWLRHWLDNIAARKVRASTLDGYRTKVEHRLIPALGKHRLDRLQPEHLEAYYATLTAEGLAPATVLQTHRILSRARRRADTSAGRRWWTRTGWPTPPTCGTQGTPSPRSSPRRGSPGPRCTGTCRPVRPSRSPRPTRPDA